MKKIIAVLVLLFSTNIFAAPLRYCGGMGGPRVRVLFHGKQVSMLAAKPTVEGWVVNDHGPVVSSCSITKLTDVTEGYSTVIQEAVACGSRIMYLAADKFITGHIYRDELGRLIYLPAR